MRGLHLFLLMPFLLSGCVQEEMQSIASTSSSRSSAASSLEQLPSELSIPHFASMTLSGSHLTLDRVLDQNAAYTRYHISYQSNGLLITGIMNIPSGSGSFPLLILNHGYIDPKVYTNGRGLKRKQDYLARHGFTVLHTDYRGHAGSDESPMTAKVYDGNLEYTMDSANAILAAQEAKIPHVDTSKIGMMGHSLGGGVTLAVLTGRPGLVDAAVLYAPVHADVFENFTRWRKEREEGDRTIVEFGTRETKPEIWDALSPQTFLKKIDIPILLFQGSNDKDVPKAWSDDLAKRLTDLQKNITYIEYRGEGHEFGFMWNDFMQKIVAFFQENL
jgi:dipeptidyl aminopeptidase/acylaminoacyl peptidase